MKKPFKELTRTGKINRLKANEKKYYNEELSGKEIKENIINDLNLRLKMSLQEGKDVLEFCTFKELIEDIKYINSLPDTFFDSIKEV